MANKYNLNLDNVGIFLSSLCAIHCLLTPIAIVAFPLLGVGFLDDDIFHPIVAIFVAIIGVVAFSNGYHRHKNRMIPVLALSGILMLGFAAINFQHHLLTEIGERITTLAGSTLIICAHFANWKHLGKKHCSNCRCELSNSLIKTNQVNKID